MSEIPMEWKAASSGEEELDWVLFDLVANTTTGSLTLTFFNHSRSTSGLAVTNMEIAGQLPSSQRFLVKSIELLIDVNAAAGDSADSLDASALELYINNKLMWSAPALYHTTTANASTTRTAETGGAVGTQKFELDKYLVIPGGTPFKIESLDGKTNVSAAVDKTVILRGRLVRSTV